MYGQPEIPRPTMFRQADEAFIKTAAAGFGGDRKLASLAWTAQGDRFFAEHNLDYAMRRYNQAWLLNDTNYEVYWGFGRVLVEKRKFEDAIVHLKKAVGLSGEAADQRPTLLADLAAAYSAKAAALPADRPRDRAAAFALANETFAQSTAIAPDNGETWRRWALSLEAQGDAAGAAEKATRARELGAPLTPPRR
jgi:tetratricopeptide (TPR) repeat protein